MGTSNVTIHFSTEANAQSLASCLKQLLRNLNLEAKEEN